MTENKNERKMKMKENNYEFNYEELANTLVDYLCECVGIKETIGVLLKSGFTKDDLLYLMFDETDIDDVILESED